MANKKEIQEEIKIIDESIKSLKDELVYLEREAKEDRQNENPGIFTEETFLEESDRENANVDSFEKELYETNRRIDDLKKEIEELEGKKDSYKDQIENDEKGLN